MKKEGSKKTKLKSNSNFLKKMSGLTRRNLKTHKMVALRNTASKIKYSMENDVMKRSFLGGMDLLQYSIVVKPFIYKKYRIKKPIELDILLYLYPIKLFSLSDFNFLPGMTNHGYGLKTLVELGYLQIEVRRVDKGSNVYGLTDRSKKIVKEYYEYLSGEKTIELGKYKNPFNDIKSKKIDLKRERLMFQLKRKAEKNPSKLRKSLYK